MTKTDLPKKYKCVVVRAKGGDFEVEERDLPSPKAGEVLIKTLACGVCRSDSIVTEGHMPVPYPMVPGHEIVGDVAAVGDGEKKWKVGDRVGYVFLFHRMSLVEKDMLTSVLDRDGRAVTVSVARTADTDPSPPARTGRSTASSRTAGTASTSSATPSPSQVCQRTWIPPRQVPSCVPVWYVSFSFRRTCLDED